MLSQEGEPKGVFCGTIQPGNNNLISVEGL